MLASLLLLVAVTRTARAGQAPAEADYASYPSDWCEKTVGTPTRTTGECMCRFRCEGRGCEAAQGFIWYTYARCPSCRCMPKADEDAPAPESPSDDDDDDDDAYVPLDSLNPPDYDFDDRTFAQRAFDFMDDYGHVVLALGFVVIVLSIFGPFLVFHIMAATAATTSSEKKDDQPAATASAPKKADKAD